MQKIVSMNTSSLNSTFNEKIVMLRDDVVDKNNDVSEKINDLQKQIEELEREQESYDDEEQDESDQDLGSELGDTLDVNDVNRDILNRQLAIQKIEIV